MTRYSITITTLYDESMSTFEVNFIAWHPPLHQSLATFPLWPTGDRSHNIQHVSTPRLASRRYSGFLSPIIGVNLAAPSKSGPAHEACLVKCRFHRLCVVVVVFLPEKYVSSMDALSTSHVRTKSTVIKGGINVMWPTELGHVAHLESMRDLE